MVGRIVLCLKIWKNTAVLDIEQGREDHGEVRNAIEEAIIAGRLATDSEERASPTGC